MRGRTHTQRLRQLEVLARNGGLGARHGRRYKGVRIACEQGHEAANRLTPSESSRFAAIWGPVWDRCQAEYPELSVDDLMLQFTYGDNPWRMATPEEVAEAKALLGVAE